MLKMKTWKGREGKDRAVLGSFPFLFLSFLSQQQAEGTESWWATCIPKSELKPVELVVCGVSILLIRTTYICIYKLQNTNCRISVILHANEVGLYLYLKLALHNVKINGKTHANNLHF